MDVGFCIKEAEYALRHMHHWMKAEREPTPLLLELGLKLSVSWRSTRSPLATLKMHVEKLDQERREFGLDYHDHGMTFCWKEPATSGL